MTGVKAPSRDADRSLRNRGVNGRDEADEAVDTEVTGLLAAQRADDPDESTRKAELWKGLDDFQDDPWWRRPSVRISPAVE